MCGTDDENEKKALTLNQSPDFGREPTVGPAGSPRTPVYQPKVATGTAWQQQAATVAGGAGILAQMLEAGPAADG